MKTTIKFFCATLILMVFMGCSTESLDVTEDSSLTAIKAKGAVREAGELTIANQGDGTATLVRNKNGISVQVHSTGLTAGNAYSAWFLIFERVGPPIVVNAAGNIVGGSGNSTFAGHLSKGEIGEINGTDILNDGTDGSFDDPMGSVVWIHIVDHGPAVAGTIPENIHEITGAAGLAQEWVFDPGS